MTGVKKNAVVFFGLFLVGMLFVPPSIPFMVPEAEAAATPITQNFAITGFGNAQGHSGWLHLAIDDSGIYVADRKLDEVKKFDFSGNLIFTITDNISNAADIALDSNHNIYVTDSSLGGSGSNNIKKFDSDGNYLGVFASVSSVGGIGIDSSGNVYVGSHGTSGYSGQDHVFIFDSNGNQINAIPVNNFASFYPLAVEPDGTFYISNTKTPTDHALCCKKIQFIRHIPKLYRLG